MPRGIQQSESHLEWRDYKLSPKKLRRVLALAVLVFLATFISTFSVKKTLITLIETQLATQKRCLGHGVIDLMIFPPGATIDKVTLKRACAGAQQDISLGMVKFEFWGPSFSPLGLTSTLSANPFGINLDSRQAIGMDGLQFQLNNQTVEIDKLLTGIKAPVKLNGRLSIQGQTNVAWDQSKDFKAQLGSRKITFPAQSVATPFGELELPGIVLSPVRGQISGTEKLIRVRRLTVGKSDSDVRLELSGDIRPKGNNIRNAELKLNIKFALSEELKSSVPILGLFLKQLNQKDGLYMVRLSGTPRNIRWVSPEK